MKEVSSTIFHGTVKQFVDSGLKINGKNVDAVTMSNLGRYSLLKQVGEQKPQRGRSAAIYEVDLDSYIGFSF